MRRTPSRQPASVPGATGVEDGSRGAYRRGVPCKAKNAVGRVRAAVGRKARQTVREGAALHLHLPPIRSVAENPDASKTSPAQYLERAKIIRWQTETMSNVDVCRQLLYIAERYEELADGIERPRRG